MKIALICLAAMLGNTTAGAQLTAADANQKADVLYKAGKFREAIEAYRQAVELDANNDHAIGYIAYAYNKLDDKGSAREWMRRRVDIPYQTPSVKSQTLTELALLCWDEGQVLTRAATVKAEGPSTAGKDLISIRKLVNEGQESAQKAIAIAPRSAKAFNLLNLLYRTEAALDSQHRSELLIKADEALAKAIEIYDSSTYFQQSTDLLVAPTITSIQGVEQGSKVRIGKATKIGSAGGFEAGGGPVIVEVFVGRDGKVRLPRIVYGEGKPVQSAIAAARQYEFEPTTFDGRAVQLVELITFPQAPAKSGK